MDCKVVVYYAPDYYKATNMHEFHILTVGDESWRVVEFDEHKLSKLGSVFITEGFMHWSLNEDKVLTLNLETEAFTESSGPGYTRGDVVKNTYLSTGRCLSLLRECGELSWEVWEMCRDTFEWRKSGEFSLEGHKSEFESTRCNVGITPVGWVKYLEALILCVICAGRRF
ncbi:Unknown protein [Striga hermonthica]|uniref:F-box associated domain-containing protein n=1 Tax=Striga hermonthica TaxID=68872 RepID=A0A9N7RHU3_STRHE|nr:Unknown protein [Striga hermonthica]